MPRSTQARDSATLDQFSALAQRQGVAARNLVNADELKAWLQELLASRFGSPAQNAKEAGPPPRQAACQRWLLSVARKWMIRQGQTETHQPEGDALAQSPAWIQHAVANGTPPQRLCLLSSEREILAGILDWMRSDDGPSLASDWTRISVEQAIASEKAWIDAMAKAALKKDLDAADAAGTTLFADSPAPGPDGRFGWRWVQVHSSDALDREGALMRHCVGFYADDVASDRASIYSLRDPDNKPRLTLETQEGEIAQLKAFANQACPPDLFARVADFAKAFESLCKARDWPLKVADEAETAGVFLSPVFGLVFAGSQPPAELARRFALDLEQTPFGAAQALPVLAALGWTEMFRIALPFASKQLKNKALAKASQHGRLELVELLLPRLDPKADESSALIQAAENGHLSIVKRLIPLCDPQLHNSLALVCAAAQGHHSTVELLIPHCDAKANGSFALRSAAGKGRLSIVELLIPRSDPKAHGSSAFISAASAGHLEVAKLLLPYSDPTANNSQALRCAAAKGHVAIVELIIPRLHSTADNSDALISAVAEGHLAIARLLLPHSDPKADDSQALSLAADRGHLALAELLLPHSDPKANDSDALKNAAFNGHLEMVELLLPYSDPKAGDSCSLRLAAGSGHLPVVEFLLPFSDPAANESQALRYAVDNGRLSVVEFLLPFSPIADQLKALEAARLSEKSEIAPLIQAAIDAQAHPQTPELASVGHKLLHQRQRQSQPTLAPPQSSLNSAL